MDLLTLFGLFSVAAMLVFYALEDRSDWFIVAFAAACLLASLYGFPSRSVALRPRGGNLGRRRNLSLASQDTCEIKLGHGPARNGASPTPGQAPTTMKGGPVTESNQISRRMRSISPLRIATSRRSLNLQSQLGNHALAHDELLDLPGHRHREFVDELDVARYLVVGDLIAAERPDLLFA